MNKVILMGRVGQDPVLKHFKTTSIVELRIATIENVKVGENYQKMTEWHNVIFFGKRALTVADFFKKGSQILVHGKIQTKKYEDKKGDTRYVTQIMADSFEFVDGGARKNEARPNQESFAEFGPEPSFDSDEELPF